MDRGNNKKQALRTAPIIHILILFVVFLLLCVFGIVLLFTSEAGGIMAISATFPLACVVGIIGYVLALRYLMTKKPADITKTICNTVLVTVGLAVTTFVLLFSFFFAIPGLLLNLQEELAQHPDRTLLIGSILPQAGYLMFIITVLILLWYLFIYCPFKYLHK